MSDRYAASSYYEQLHPAQAHSQVGMSPYVPSYQRHNYGSSSYNPYGSYGYAGAVGGGSAYMPNYYRYAPYASPHYSQHPGMFTAAGQQLIPSSVLHYPPRAQQQQQQQLQQQQQQQHSYNSAYNHAHAHSLSSYSYEPPAPALYSASSYGQSRGFAAYQSAASHYATAGRSTTPAPNRTVLPHNYVPNYTESLQPLVNNKPEDAQPEQLELEAASPAQRLTTSPPLISATGTDSGISNCSTRARSDSSQSTPVYSGEYPVNMSVESASCVSYHCPADGRDYEEEQPQSQQQQQQQSQQQQSQQQQQQQREQQPEQHKAAIAATSLDTSDDISATAAASTSAAAAAAASHVNDIDKAATAREEGREGAGNEEQPDVVRRAEINLTQSNNKESTATTTTTGTTTATSTGTGTNLAPQDIAEQPATNQINDDDAAEQTQPSATATNTTTTTSHNWSPKPRRPRTPPAPQNSPVGYGLTTSAATTPTVPPALAPLLSSSSNNNNNSSNKRHATAKNRNSSSSNNNSCSNSNNSNSGNNRIIECDLIPSKKSKRKSSRKETESEHVDATESTVREQIRDIKPLPGFLQAFGSTEIGRFSERFLQTPESLVERLAEEYASSNMSSGSSNSGNHASNYYDATASGNCHNGYYHYEEQPHNLAYYQSQQMSRNYRMRNQPQHYGYPDYAAYERYGYAAYNAARSRYGEIRCNGY